MNVGKAAALTAGIVGAIAIGVAIGPTVHDRWLDDKTSTPATTASVPSEPPAAEKSAGAPTRRRAERAAPAATREFAAKKGIDTLETVPVGVWSSELRARVKKVLNPGAKLELAAADFSNAEDFVTVAHAARNTQVPFVVLKHRVLEEGRTLADAIHEFKPELNAKAEATRARAAAREDLTVAG